MRFEQNLLISFNHALLINFKMLIFQYVFDIFHKKEWYFSKNFKMIFPILKGSTAFELSQFSKSFKTSYFKNY